MKEQHCSIVSDVIKHTSISRKNFPWNKPWRMNRGEWSFSTTCGGEWSFSITCGGEWLFSITRGGEWPLVPLHWGFFLTGGYSNDGAYDWTMTIFIPYKIYLKQILIQATFYKWKIQKLLLRNFVKKCFLDFSLIKRCLDKKILNINLVGNKNRHSFCIYDEPQKWCLDHFSKNGYFWIF